MSKNQRKNIIVTGATGNLGRAMVSRLLSDGHRVIATTLRPGKEDKPQDQYETHQLDLADEQAASAFVNGIIQRHKTIHAALLLAGGYTGGTIRDTTSETIQDRKSTRLNSSHVKISYAVFCLKKKKK